MRYAHQLFSSRVALIGEEARFQPHNDISSAAHGPPFRLMNSRLRRKAISPPSNEKYVIEMVVHARAQNLLAIRGFSEASVAKIQAAAAKVDKSGSSGRFQTGLQCRIARQRVIKVQR